MAFFSKTIDTLKGALRKTAQVLNTDVRTLFVPGRQIDDALLAELEEKFLQADMGVNNVERIVGAVRDRWRMGKIRNAQEAEEVIREQMVANWPPADRELRFAPSGPTVILVGDQWRRKNHQHRQARVAAEEPDEQEGDGLRQ